MLVVTPIMSVEDLCRGETSFLARYPRCFLKVQSIKFGSATAFNIQSSAILMAVLAPRELLVNSTSLTPDR